MNKLTAEQLRSW